MPKKLTYDVLLTKLNERNKKVEPVELLSQPCDYEGQNSKLLFKCKHNHTWKGTYSNTIYLKRGCPHCKKQKERLNKRTSWEVLLPKLKKSHQNKYTYKKESYTNSVSNIEITCSLHGTFHQTPLDIIKFKRQCPKCKKEHELNKKYNTFITKAKAVHNDFYDYSLTEKENIGKPIPVTIICPEHGIFKQQPGDHLRGRSCKQCSGKGSSKKSIQWLTYLEETLGIKIIHAGNVGEYKIPGTRYTADGYCKENNTIYEFHGDLFHGNPEIFPSDYVCNMYTKGETAGSLYQKTKLREQEIQALGYNLVVIWENDFDKMGIDVDIDVKSIIRKHNHTTPEEQLNQIRLELLDDNFKGYKHKHNYKCLVCGSKYTTTLTQRLQTYKKRKIVGCANCSNDVKHLTNVTKHLPKDSYIIKDGAIIFENYTALYIQRLKGNSKKQLIHLQQQYKNQNIKLLIMFNDEFTDNKTIALSKIKHLAGISEVERVHGRQCIVREISPKEKNEFLNRNHIQGKDVSQINLGAFYQDRLVAVMTFCAPRIIMSGQHQKDGSWELSRFAADITKRIPGIASKLLTHFKNNYEWSYIYSYADKRWSEGVVYKKLGFTLEKTNPPSYWYVIDGKRKHRWGYRKDVLKNICPNYDPNLTEYQNMLNWGYDRVWDCGTLKYTLTNIST